MKSIYDILLGEISQLQKSIVWLHFFRRKSYILVDKDSEKNSTY